MRTGRVFFRAGPQIDVALLLCVVAIATLGVVNLYSATSYYIGHPNAVEAAKADIYVSQIYWIVIGVLFAVLAAAIDYRHFERMAMLFYLGGLVLLGLVIVFASDVRGAKRWIQLGSFAFQPSELIKVFVILVVARHLHNDPKTEPRTLLDLAIPVGLTLVPALCVMYQPDFGTALTYLLIALSMLAMMKLRTRSLLTVVIGTATLAPLVFHHVLLKYQQLRIQSFLDPTRYKEDASWHQLNSLTAIGNGGIFGEGYMQGTQNQFGNLPDQYSDFPFAVFAEDWGLMGCIVLLSLYCFLCVWAIHIASQAKDRFGAAVAVGVGAMIFWHTFFNIGMELGVLPVVGSTLPLFSYGGSSIVTVLIGLGLLMNVSMRK